MAKLYSILAAAGGAETGFDLAPTAKLAWIGASRYAGLAADQWLTGKLYADTNDHLIRVLDLETRRLGALAVD